MRARLLLSVAVVLIAVIAVSSMLSNVYAVSVASDEYVFDFKFGSSGSGDGQFNYPNGVAYDHNNNRIIITDGTNKNVQVFDKDGNFLFSISESGFSPTAVAYDHNHDRILVAAWTLGGDKIYVYDKDGTLLFTINELTPNGVAYDHKRDRIIVGSQFNSNVKIFDKDGRYITGIGTYGSGNGQFKGVWCVAYDDKNERLLVCDPNNYRIQVFDRDYNHLFNITVGSNDIDVTYDNNNDRIIVPRQEKDRRGWTIDWKVRVFDKDGNYPFEFSTKLSDERYIPYLRGVAYDHNNNRIIVTDAANKVIKVFSPSRSLILYEDMNESDGIIDLGKSVTAKTKTKNNNDANVTFRWIDPSNNEVRNTTVPIVNGEASDTYTPNQVGTWKVVAKFSDGTIVVKELQVPFQVVPESIIGALSVIGSSLAVLAVYRRKRSI
jgi:hypothetical protein